MKKTYQDMMVEVDMLRKGSYVGKSYRQIRSSWKEIRFKICDNNVFPKKNGLRLGRCM